MTHVKLVYFRDSGKYYSEGELDLPDFAVKGVDRRQLHFHEVLKHVREMLDRGERPGLVEGHDFHVLVTVFTENGPLPCLMTRCTAGNLAMTDIREHPVTNHRREVFHECSCDGKEPGPMGGGA
jgi:hypothetical protein